MADDQISTPAAPQAEPDEGFLHSLATSLGIDPEGVVSAAKAIRANPVQTAKDIGSEAYSELSQVGNNQIDTAKKAAQGVADTITNPDAKATASARIHASGLTNKIIGGAEYASSVIPMFGGNIVKAEEQGAKGNTRGMLGTTVGTVAPLITDTEPVQAVKMHLLDTAKTFGESAKEGLTKAVEAKHPEGSLEAGFAKLGGKKVGQTSVEPSDSPITDTAQGGHAGGGVASVEELNRPGRFVKVSRSGQLTDQGKTPDFNLSSGQAGYQVMPDGSFDLKAGQETPIHKNAIQKYASDIYGKPEPSFNGMSNKIGDSPKLVAASKPNTFELNGDEEPQTTAQKLIEKFGTTTDHSKAGFILSDGSMVPLNGEHNGMLDQVGQTGPTNREDFINNEGAIRTRFRTGRGGDEVVFSVPKGGVTPEQVDQLRQSVAKVGRYGNAVMEVGDSGGKSTAKEFVRPSDVEPMLKEIGAHPDQKAPAISVTTDNNGIRWAATADGVRVSVPGRIPENEVQAYATDKIAEQAKMQDAVKAKVAGVSPAEPVSTDAEVSPNTELQASAQKYAKKLGMPEISHDPVPVDLDRAREIAKIYAESKHDPDNPRVKAAYDALKSETLDQFHHLKNDLGLKFEPKSEDPYTSAGQMMDDIKNNKRLQVFTGSSTGPDHPLSETAPGTGGESYNTIFRWVHDAMGHAAGGNDFSEGGEKSATEAHAQMYSDTARPAMRNETEGQTSWFFHNPEVESGAKQPGDFAEQKAAILPDTSADWHNNAGKMASENEAGGINPRTGKSDMTGFATEIMPERRQALDHAPTPQDFKDFYDKNKDIFDAHPELRVGWDNKSAVEGGHEINVGAVGKDASRVAKKLDQKSSFDIAKGDIIPTGGTGLRTDFSNYSLEDRLKDLNGENHSDTPGFEHLSKDIYDHLEPDERDYLKGNKTLQRNVMAQYHKISPSVNETTNAMQAGAALGGWWQRYIDVFHGLVGEKEGQTLYHGSPTKGIKNLELRSGNNSTIFGSEPIQRAGIFLTPDRDFASGFAGKNGEVTQHTANFKNTADFTNPSYEYQEKLTNDLVAQGVDRHWLETAPVKNWERFDGTDGKEFVESLKKAGYDSVKIEEPNDEGKSKPAYIAFSPEQVKPTADQVANTIGPSHAEVLKQWHAAVSGNKSVEDANNLAWHSYADWLDAGKPTDRKSINDIVKNNAAQPEGSTKKGNAAISDTLDNKGKVLSKGLDTNKLFLLINSPEMMGERPFSGDVYREDAKNPLMGPTEGARKIPSMGASVAGKGNLNRLVIDAHIRDFYGRKNSAGPAAQYIADSAHLRQSAEALGLKGGEGQEQLWGTVLGLKQLLKEGLTPAEAGGKLNADVINRIGKDYAEVIANDPEISAPGGILDRLKDKYGIGRGSTSTGTADSKAPSTNAGQGQSAGSQKAINQTQLEQTAKRIRGQISDSKIKKPASTEPEESEDEGDTSFEFGANEKPKPTPKPKKGGKNEVNAMSFLRGIEGLKSPGNK